MKDNNDYLSPTSIVNVINRYSNGKMNNDKFIKLVELNSLPNPTINNTQDNDTSYYSRHPEIAEDLGLIDKGDSYIILSNRLTI